MRKRAKLEVPEESSDSDSFVELEPFEETEESMRYNQAHVLVTTARNDAESKWEHQIRLELQFASLSRDDEMEPSQSYYRRFQKRTYCSSWVANLVNGRGADVAKFATLPQFEDMHSRDLKFKNNQALIGECKRTRFYSELTIVSDIIVPRPKLKLTHLSQCYSRLTTIHIDSIGCVTFAFLRYTPALTSLSLLSCRLSSVPREIAELKQLEMLDISYNPIRRVPKFVVELPALLYIYLPSQVRAPYPIRLGRSMVNFERSSSQHPLFGSCYFENRYALFSIITSGLASADNKVETTWTRFLTRGWYDPRLFLFIWSFLSSLTV